MLDELEEYIKLGGWMGALENKQCVVIYVQ